MISECIIAIEGLEVSAHVGVPDEERAVAQRLLLDLRFVAAIQPEDFQDDLSLTVDYHAVSIRVAAIAAERPRKLIETLASEITDILMKEFSLRLVELTIRKFILPNAEWVSVSIRRG